MESEGTLLVLEQAFLLTGCRVITGLLIVTVVEAETLGSSALVAVIV
jgi:hypothetical protein